MFQALRSQGQAQVFKAVLARGAVEACIEAFAGDALDRIAILMMAGIRHKERYTPDFS